MLSGNWLGFSPLGWLIIVCYAVAIVVCFICVMCDTDQGLLGKISTVVTEDIPNYLGKLLRMCIGERFASAITGCLSGSIDYVCYKPNPILQTFYLAIILGAYYMVVVCGYPMLPCRFLPTWHKYTAFASVMACLWLWYLACTVSPGIITHENLHRYQCYPSDQYLFPPNRKCPTVGIVKPPRSKFCKLTNAHVARFDHFCPWLNQAVGAENYRYFIAFLAGHCLLLTYGALGMGGLLLSEVAEKELLTSQFFNAKTNTHVPATKWVVFQYLMFNNWGIMAVAVLCAVMAVVLFGFLVYHLWLTARNMTTNESYKWGDLKKAHLRYTRRYHDEAKARAARRADRQKKKQKNGGDGDSSSSESEEEMPPFEEYPRNHFNRGVLLNFMEVLRPFSLREPPVRAPEFDRPTAANSNGKDKAAGQGEPNEGGDDDAAVVTSKSKKARRRNKNKKRKQGQSNKDENDSDDGEVGAEN